MGIAKLYGQKASGTNINGIIKDYHVYAGANVSAGDLVEYINGIAGQITGTSSDTTIVSDSGVSTPVLCAIELNSNKVFLAHYYGSDRILYGVILTIEGVNIVAGTDTVLSSVAKSGEYISMQLLPNGDVFIAHSHTSGYFYLYAMVCTINDTTITVGTDTRLSGSRYSAYGVSTELLSNGNIFISHSSSSTDYYLYAMICSIDGTTITAGTDTKLGKDYSTGNISSTALLENGNVFIAHSGVDYYLYAIICTIDGTTITAGTDTKLINSSKSAYRLSIELLPSGNVFISHSWGSSYYLYGTVCSITDTKVTAGTPTSLANVSYAGYEISTELLPSGEVLTVHCHTQSYYYLYAMICSIDGTTITAGEDTALSTETDTGREISTQLLENGVIFISHTSSLNSAKSLFAQIWQLDEENNVLTNEIVINEYETQVRKTTTSQFDGIAKTSGVGGDNTGHKDLVSIYTLPIIVNLVKNGDFETGTDGWSILSNWADIIDILSIDTTSSSGDKCMLLKVKTSSSASSVVYVECPVTLIANHIYYASCYYRGATANYTYMIPGIQLRDENENTVCGGKLSSAISNLVTWQKISTYGTSNANSKGTVILWIARGASNGGIEAGMGLYYDNVKVYDLTEIYGAGNEPTKEWCDENL